MSLAYSSLDELYGLTNPKSSTELSLLNVEQEAICKLRQPKPKAKKMKQLGKYAEYEGSDINNRNKVITTNDVPMTDLHKATLDCKNKGRERQEVEGYNNHNMEFSNFGGELDMPDDYDLKKYLLNAEEMEALENNMMLKTQNDGIKLNKGFMPMDSNEVNNNNKKNKKKNNNNNNNNNNRNGNNSNINSNDDDEIDETVMDKYMNLLLYVLSGILLILLMEQILQLGIKMKM
jgi:hypothetical protein